MVKFRENPGWVADQLTICRTGEASPAMQRRRQWVWLLLVPSLGSGYMAWLMWQAQSDAKWLFGVLTVFFLSLATAPLWPRRGSSASTPPLAETRFASHRLRLIAGRLVF